MPGIEWTPIKMVRHIFGQEYVDIIANGAIDGPGVPINWGVSGVSDADDQSTHSLVRLGVEAHGFPPRVRAPP